MSSVHFLGPQNTPKSLAENLGRSPRFPIASLQRCPRNPAGFKGPMLRPLLLRGRRGGEVREEWSKWSMPRAPETLAPPLFILNCFYAACWFCCAMLIQMNQLKLVVGIVLMTICATLVTALNCYVGTEQNFVKYSSTGSCMTVALNYEGLCTLTISSLGYYCEQQLHVERRQTITIRQWMSLK